MACKLLHRGKQGNEGKRQREICIRGGSPAYEGNVYDIRIMRAWVFLLRRATVPSRCPIRTTDLSFSPLLLLVLLSSPFLTFSKSHFQTTLLDRGKENESAFPSVCARACVEKEKSINARSTVCSRLNGEPALFRLAAFHFSLLPTAVIILIYEQRFLPRATDRG